MLTIPNTTKRKGKHEIINRLNEILESIDVGGEQSRQFFHKIQAINTLLKDLG